jgi:hypothetical protein
LGLGLGLGLGLELLGAAVVGGVAELPQLLQLLPGQG